MPDEDVSHGAEGRVDTRSPTRPIAIPAAWDLRGGLAGTAGAGAAVDTTLSRVHHSHRITAAPAVASGKQGRGDGLVRPT
jgi:hypothetical protein